MFGLWLSGWISNQNWSNPSNFAPFVAETPKLNRNSIPNRLRILRRFRIWTQQWSSSPQSQLISQSGKVGFCHESLRSEVRTDQTEPISKLGTKLWTKNSNLYPNHCRVTQTTTVWRDPMVNFICLSLTKRRNSFCFELCIRGFSMSICTPKAVTRTFA